MDLKDKQILMNFTVYIRDYFIQNHNFRFKDFLNDIALWKAKNDDYGEADLWWVFMLQRA